MVIEVLLSLLLTLLAVVGFLFNLYIVVAILLNKEVSKVFFTNLDSKGPCVFMCFIATKNPNLASCKNIFFYFFKF